MPRRGETAMQPIDKMDIVVQATVNEKTDGKRLGPSLGEHMHRWWFPQLLRPLKLLRGLRFSVPRLMAPARFFNKPKAEINSGRQECWMRGRSHSQTHMTGMIHGQPVISAKQERGRGKGMPNG